MSQSTKASQVPSPTQGQAVLARSGHGSSAQAPHPAPLAGLVAAHFTERELFQLRNACRDSDNENASRFLEAALARAGGKS